MFLHELYEAVHQMFLQKLHNAVYHMFYHCRYLPCSHERKVSENSSEADTWKDIAHQDITGTKTFMVRQLVVGLIKM